MHRISLRLELANELVTIHMRMKDCLDLVSMKNQQVTGNKQYPILIIYQVKLVEV